MALCAEDLDSVEVALRFFGQCHGAEDAARLSRGGHTPLTH
jgi:hypothetical protein